MNSAFRQSAIVVGLTALIGIGFVFWITTSPPPAKSTTVTTDAKVVMANPDQRDPNAPFEPTVGQQGKDVVWVPTGDALVQKMLDMANVTAKDYLIDLGSGDGRTVIAAARRDGGRHRVQSRHGRALREERGRGERRQQGVVHSRRPVPG